MIHTGDYICDIYYDNLIRVSQSNYQSAKIMKETARSQTTRDVLAKSKRGRWASTLRRKGSPVRSHLGLV